jgi:hypothetical protein
MTVSHAAPATLADLDATKTEIMAKLNELHGSARRTDLFPLFLQVILSAAIGFLVWRAQTGISNQIDSAKTRLTSQLALSQDYFKERMKVYADLYAAALRVSESAHRLSEAQQSPADLTDAIFDLNKRKTTNFLYSSEDLLDLSTKLWRDALILVQDSRQTRALNEIDRYVAAIGTRMRIELSIKALEAATANLIAEDDARATKRKK